jgi:hypothetical protein
MKKLFFLTLVAFPYVLSAQWSGPDVNKRIFYSAGHVGIGIDVPLYRFHIKTTDNNPLWWSETAEANLVFLRSNLEFRSKVSASLPSLSWYSSSGARQASIGGKPGSLSLLLENGSHFYVAGGNVGIGTTDTKGYELAVAGKVVCEEVVVKLRQAWPDYVFSEEYHLPSLADLFAYIKENHHLPEIPSAAEVTQQGIPVGEMNAILLKKIEELTLYLFEAREERERLELRISSLEKTLKGE